MMIVSATPPAIYYCRWLALARDFYQRRQHQHQLQACSSTNNGVSRDQAVQLRTRRSAIYLRYCFVHRPECRSTLDAEDVIRNRQAYIVGRLPARYRVIHKVQLTNHVVVPRRTRVSPADGSTV